MFDGTFGSMLPSSVSSWQLAAFRHANRLAIRAAGGVDALAGVARDDAGGGEERRRARFFLSSRSMPTADAEDTGRS